MNKLKVIQELKELYPNKNIICLPQDDPSEILCELEPSSQHADYSLAISVIDKSIKHHHLQTTEYYKVIRGELTLFVDGVEHRLSQGDKFTLKPGQVHYAIGDETWVECYSEPGWTIEDHLLN